MAQNRHRIGIKWYKMIYIDKNKAQNGTELAQNSVQKAQNKRIGTEWQRLGTE